MSDTLEIFGTEYTNVAGVKATDDNNQTKTYIRPQGTKSISANGTGIDVTAYAAVDVAVPAPSPSLQTKTKSYTPSETAQSETVSADTGYDGLDEVSISVGAISSTYVGSGVTRQGATTYRAGTSQQTIASGTYLTGSQTIAAVSQTNLSAENIKSGTTISISNGQSNIWSVTGTYSGGGGGIGTLLATKSLGTISTSSTSAADTGQTVSVTGFNGYDMLVAVTSCTKTNGRHYASVNVITLAGMSAIGTIDSVSLTNATLNIKISSAGAASSRAGTTKYGVYVNAASLSGSTITLTMYRRYNSTSTGTINGTYTTKVYGVKIYENI